MPIKITIHLMSGETLEYSARLYQGRARFLTHQQRMQEMVLKHLDLTSFEWRVKLIHNDDEERMVAIYKDHIQQHIQENHQPRRTWFYSIPSEEEQGLEIQKILEEYRNNYRIRMEEQRYYTEDTIIYAMVEKTNWGEIVSDDDDDDDDDDVDL